MKNKSSKLKLLIAGLTVATVSVALAVYTLASSSVDYTSYSQSYISPSDISIQGEAAYVADATLGKVYKTSLDSNSVTKQWDAKRPVNAVVADGADVYALSGELDGTITKLDADLNVVTTAETGHTPVSAVVNDGKLYVANRFSSNVTVYNTSDLKKVATIDVGREPMDMEIVGDKLYVAKHLTEDAATDDVVSANIAVVNLKDNTKTAEIPMLNGTDGVKGIVASPDGKYLYVSHILARYAYPTSQLDRGWINTNAISIIDVQKNALKTAFMLDEVELGSPNPWGVAMNGDQLVVSISGARQLITIDTTDLLKRIADVEAGKNSNVKTVDEIPNYLPFLDGLRNRISLNGEGARNLAVSDGKAYVCQYFTGIVEIVNLAESKSTDAISLGTQPEANDARKGETLWYDGTKCYQSWESCASCHPDARVDGINWDNLNDGLGNPKQAASMLYSHRTPPVMITGARDSAELAVRKGMQYIQFNTMSEEQVSYIDEYLKTLTPVQSPYLNRDGSLTESAERGKELFESTGCASCHPAPLYTDLKMHTSEILNDKDKNPNWENRKFATPTLVEIWRTAPYFFNGTFTTLKEAVVASLPENHGLSDQDITDLTNFVASIGNQNEYYGVEQVRSTNAAGVEKINALQEGSTINSISLKKQLETEQGATVTATLYQKDGTEISKTTQTLKNDMKVGDTAKIKTEIQVPKGLEKGSYLVVSITDKDGSNLATDLRLTY